MTQVLIILVVTVSLFGGMYLIKRMQHQSRQQKLQTILIVAAVALILLAFSGRAHWITGAVGALFALLRASLPGLIRMAPLLQQVMQRQHNQAPPQGRSQVVTDTILMWLDQQTGEMDGEVRQGAFQHKSLSELTETQCQQLFDECSQHDHEAAQLLEAYFDRRFNRRPNSKFEENKNTSSGGFQETMDRSEALQILGLSEPISKEQVESAHRKLMQKLHPDRGGSDYLAIKLNQAKQVLLG